MRFDEFEPGVIFQDPSLGYWQCSDVGQRVVIALPLAHEHSTFTGEAYTQDERVFNEIDIVACKLIKRPDTGGNMSRASLDEDLAKQPLYELRFQRDITELVMRHIDRMNDVCEQDTAERIVESFVKGFDQLFEPYLNEKFPGRQAMLADVARRRAMNTLNDQQPSVASSRRPDGKPRRGRKQD